jgi:hypothetical protein
MILIRRMLLAGLTASLAAPAIVRASSLMPISAHIFDPFYLDSRVSRYLWDMSTLLMETWKWSPVELNLFYDLSAE